MARLLPPDSGVPTRDATRPEISSSPTATEYAASIRAGTKLKPGEYKVDVKGSEATFKLDGKIVKVPATLQAETSAYKDTPSKQLIPMFERSTLAER